MQTTKDQLKRLDRLKKRSDFLRVQKTGQKWVAGSVVFHALENDDETTRIGFTVTKRVHKSAVRRNRIRRRLKAASADIFSAHAQAGVDYVLIGRAETEICNYAQLKRDLKWCLKRTGFLSDEN